MTDAATGRTIVYNGEFYNFRQVRDELQHSGESFRTRSDTEVLLKLAVGDPRDWIHRVNGMFAFAVWDSEARALTIVRDRFGVKPLYYVESAGGMAFASEIKALVGVDVGAGGVGRTTERPLLAEYLAFGHVLEPNTLFAGVKQLPAGHFMRIFSGDPRVEIVRYWVEGEEVLRCGAVGDTGEQGFSEAFGNAVNLRLVSDVPVGSFNSGGVDSSLVTAEMRHRSTGEMHTFSVSFSEPEFDETRYADEVASKLGTLHHTVALSPGAFLELLPRAIWHHDEPLCHANSVHLMHLSSIASKYVTVVLTGEGADELFFGYPRLHIARLGRTLGSSGAIGARMIGASPWLSRAQRGEKLVDRLAGIYAPEIECHRLVGRADLRALIGSESYCGSRCAVREGIPTDQSSIEAILEYERRTHLMSILMRLDKMTMAHGLEARAPFMDYELVLWSKAIQFKQKVGLGWENKRLLKRVAARRFSNALVYRPKVGFGVPLGRWFRMERRFRELLASLCEPSAFVCSMMPRHAIQAIVADHCELGRDRTAALWLLLNLEIWAQVMLKAPQPAELLTEG